MGQQTIDDPIDGPEAPVLAHKVDVVQEGVAKEEHASACDEASGEQQQVDQLVPWHRDVVGIEDGTPKESIRIAGEDVAQVRLLAEGLPQEEGECRVPKVARSVVATVRRSPETRGMTEGVVEQKYVRVKALFDAVAMESIVSCNSTKVNPEEGENIPVGSVWCRYSCRRRLNGRSHPGARITAVCLPRRTDGHGQVRACSLICSTILIDAQESQAVVGWDIAGV